MKSIMLLAASIAFITACGQDKSKRPSPPALAKETISSGAVVTIDYSAPSVKGRTIGKDLEPKVGQVWRAGANEATTFEVSKDVKIEGQPLAKGKYTLFTLWNQDGTWTIIFNKVLKDDKGKPVWGAFDYEKDKAQDALKVNVKPGKAPAFQEKLAYKIAKDGKVSLLWGDGETDFKVE
ncbi:MAG: DUF2911 domain-containing protein [Chitinophagaceae bacterium]